MPPVKYVLVPCDDAQPLSELELELADDARSGDPLRSHLISHFCEGSVDPKAVKEQLGSLSQDMDLSALEQGTVETFPLTRPSEANGNAAVTMYLDECGVLKNKPRNERATRLAAECGHASPLHGDIFVGREQLGTGGRQVVDFTITDMDSSARWMASAAAANYEHMVATKKMHAQMEGSFKQINVGENEDGSGLPGGETDAYSWSQTKSDLEVHFPIPAVCKAKDCKVKFTTSALSVAIAGAEPTLVGAALHAKVRPDECSWSISGEGESRVLVVTLEKAVEATWHDLMIQT
jgi:hypothetical protein